MRGIEPLRPDGMAIISALLDNYGTLFHSHSRPSKSDPPIPPGKMGKGVGDWQSYVRTRRGVLYQVNHFSVGFLIENNYLERTSQERVLGHWERFRVAREIKSVSRFSPDVLRVILRMAAGERLQRVPNSHIGNFKPGYHVRLLQNDGTIPVVGRVFFILTQYDLLKTDGVSSIYTLAGSGQRVASYALSSRKTIPALAR